MPLDPDAAELLSCLAQSAAPRTETLSAAQHRAMADAATDMFPGEKAQIERVETFLIQGQVGPVRVRLYAHGVEQLPTLVFFHGGGFVVGSLESHDELARDLAKRSGWNVLSVDYRLAPEHPYPGPFDDCYSALEWAASPAGAASGIDASRLAVGGDSAGGTLAAAVALAAKERNGPKIVHQLLIYPAMDTDFETRSYNDNAEGYLLTRAAMKWYWGHYLGGAEADHLAAPGRAKDTSGLPPATIITAEYDPLRDDGERYAAAMRKAGCAVELKRFPGVIHGFLMMGMQSRGIEAREYLAVRLKTAS